MLGSVRAATALTQAGIPIGAVPAESSPSGWTGAASSQWRCARLRLAPEAARPRRDGTPMAGRHGAGATV